jgi:pimeloyl-ACP methyl ester carboxylesterase
MRKADFSNPQLRQGITGFMPDLDLDDPQVQAAVRDFRAPLGLIDQLRGVSAGALTAALSVHDPVLVVQGTRDPVARPGSTKRLIAKLPQPPICVEVDSEHNLADLANPAWPTVRQAVLDFAAHIAAGTR